MEEKVKNYEQNLRLLCESVGIKDPSKIETIVIVIHSTCASLELQCLNEEDERCEFPLTWNQHTEGVYHLKYTLPTSSKYPGKIVQFRMVDSGDGLSVNFVV